MTVMRAVGLITDKRNIPGLFVLESVQYSVLYVTQCTTWPVSKTCH